MAMENLPADLRPDEAMHVLHFLHAMPGTSALLKITLKPLIFYEYANNETQLICIKPYQNERHGLRQSNHAEEELLKDSVNLLDIIKGSISCFDNKNMKLNLEIFVNNSPCNSCTPKLLRFKQQISNLGFARESLKFVIQFQHIYKPDKNRSSIGELRRGGIHVKPMKWKEFYKNFLKWLQLNRSENREGARSPTPNPLPVDRNENREDVKSPTPPPPLSDESSSEDEQDTVGAHANYIGEAAKNTNSSHLFTDSSGEEEDTSEAYVPDNGEDVKCPKTRNIFAESVDFIEEKGSASAYTRPDVEEEIYFSKPFRESGIYPASGIHPSPSRASRISHSSSKSSWVNPSPSRASGIGSRYNPSISAPQLSRPMRRTSWDGSTGRPSDDSVGKKSLKDFRAIPTVGSTDISEDSMSISLSGLRDDECIREDADIISHLYSVSKDWAVQFKLEQNLEVRHELDSLRPY